jgi:hypothetical protein
MNFKDADKVLSTINASDSVEHTRSNNRSKVQNLFDGLPPMTPDEAKQAGMRINVNWLEAPVLAQQARRQYQTAFCRQNNYFKVSIPCAPEDKRQEWELTITNAINRHLKHSLPFYELMRSKFASVVAHGIGPQMWLNKQDWKPAFIAVDDLRIPTDTELSFHNLMWFAVRRRYTPWELANKAFGREADKGWKTDIIQKVLDEYKDDNTATNTTDDWANAPEKMMELWKQNMGYYDSDAVPTIPVWHFYYLDETKPRETAWKLKVVPAQSGIKGLDDNTFLYDSGDATFADDLSELLHVQFGDLNGKAPFMYHSVRSLGFLLMEPCYWANLTLCRLIQHAWENFNMLFRSNDPNDRARASKVELFDKGWIDNSVAIVPREQRHQIDAGLVEMVMAKMKQLQGEASSAYTQDVDTGTSKEQTAFETGVKLNQVNAMMSGLLDTASHYETFAYREICRRFCIKDSMNKDVQLFRNECKKAGIPVEYLNVSLWDVTPDMPLGSGNQTLELVQAQQLMQQRGSFTGSAQQKILHMFVAAVTQDAKLATELAPLDAGSTPSPAKTFAASIFGTLMQGVPAPQQPQLNPIDQIDVLLGLTAGVIARVEKTPGMSTVGEVTGLSTVLGFVQQLVQQLAQDEQQKPRVKQYMDALGNLGNQVKAIGQQMQQAQQQGEVPKMSINYKDAPPDIRRQMEVREGFQPSSHPEASLDDKTAKAVHAISINEAKATQKEEHQNIAFHNDQQRKNVETLAEIERNKAKADSEPKQETVATE